MRETTIAALLLLLLLGFNVGCSSHDDTSRFGKVGEFGQKISDYVRGDTALKAAQRMESQYYPDERREGINRLVDRTYGRRPPYTTRYEQIAQYDSDYLVRATAIRALNRSRDAGATDVFVKSLDDPNDLIRLEGAKALGNIPDDRAVPSLVKISESTGENRDLRIAAVNALKHYKTLQIAKVLIGIVGERDFSVAWQARKSLKAMTGKDLYYDNNAWLQYITGPEKPLG
ncbi:MAG TPA: HEAT repeat domain-containing protein [Tepidisphaeraceae bacterium]|nr:HEAT repeat domain-containing protein [Tepidisphaeraceae bacterium]